MEHRIKVKEIFEAQTIHKEFYTGGIVKITKDGKTLFCQCSNHITIVNVDTVSIQQTIPSNLKEFNRFDEEDIIDDPILTYALSADEELIASGHKSGLIKLWKWKDSELSTSWKAGHKGPLTLLAFDEGGVHVVSASTDSTLKVWNIRNHVCDFKLGGLSGVTSILEYRTINDQEYLFASGDEAVIRGWHFENTNKLIYKFSGHFSRITKIVFSENNSTLISCSRDKAVIVWDLQTKKQLKTIPMYESIETATLLPECVHLPGYEKPLIGLNIAFGGENGKIRIWNVITGKELYVSGFTNESNSPVQHLIYNKENEGLFDIRANQNINIRNLDCNFSCRKQMIGYLDEILDITYFGEDEQFLAVAANSCDIHMYDKNMNCSLIKGHTDLVVSLGTSASYPDLLISGSKDNSVRVWMMNDGILKCVAVGARHTASVGSVALSSKQNAFLISGSEDTTLKCWKLPVLKYKECETLIVSKTVVAHDKPINCVCLSPKDQFVATGSQDKTAKVWSAKDLSLVGVLRGHRRAIWSVKFSPIDQVLLTSSADTTLRLWSLLDYTCLKTLEGQECSVLNCAFINRGTQIVSSGTDGVVKVWLIKSGEAISTLDKHAARVWALTVREDESTIATAGADSRIVFWKDKTDETRMAEMKCEQEKAEQEQYLANLLRAEKLLPALQYAISLNRPFEVLKIVKVLLEDNVDNLRNVIEQLNIDQKELILGYTVEWNTNSRHCYAAQLILSFLIDEIATNKLTVSEKHLQGLIAYTNRHYDRIVGNFEDIQLISYTLNMMKPRT